jgi:hypothetical protein
MLKISDISELTNYIIFPCLDLGTGEGYPFGGRLPNNTIGIDIEPKIPGTIKHDITKGIPFPDKSFNTVTAFEVFEHIDPEKRILLLVR